MMKTNFGILLFSICNLVGLNAQASFLSDVKTYFKNQSAQSRLEVEARLQGQNLSDGIKSATMTPNLVPDAKCIYNRNSLEVPASSLRISQFEVWTTRRGTLENEPSITGVIKFRDTKTLKSAGSITLPLQIQELGWITDRLSQPKGITETTFHREVDFEGVKYNAVFKRGISDIKNPIMNAELILYSIGEKSVPVVHARCSREVTKD